MKLKTDRTKLIIGILAGTAVLAAAFYGGIWFAVSRHGGAAAGEGTPVASSGEAAATSTLDMQLFWKSLDFVKEKYFKPAEIDNQKLLYGAISGAIDSLGDPYSRFFAPDDAQKFEEDIEGNFGGIGAEIGIRDEELLIIAPLKGNPAEAAGLRASDRILRIDDTAVTADMSVDEAVKLIRGAVGTDVTLLIDREGWSEPKPFTIMRGDIVVPTLDSEMLDGDIAYVHLYTFNANAPLAFYQASVAALLKGSRGLLLDLRGNPGGYLEVATTIAGWFMDRGKLVVEEHFPGGMVRPFYANGTGAWKSVPVVVLVDGGSASASEILAGALRDERGATIVGTKTFGKGTVQEVETLSDGSKVKVSVAEWVTPEGHHIDGKGITPDVEVPLSAEDADAGKDPQLDKALEVLQEQSRDTEVIPTILL